MTIQDRVRQHYVKWAAAGQWHQPELPDCLDFMLTEVAEAIELRLRRNSAYVRNNPTDDMPTDVDLAIEIFDAIMMGCIALDLLDIDLQRIAEHKLAQMDKKRGFDQEP